MQLSVNFKNRPKLLNINKPEFSEQKSILRGENYIDMNFNMKKGVKFKMFVIVFSIVVNLQCQVSSSGNFAVVDSKITSMEGN